MSKDRGLRLSSVSTLVVVAVTLLVLVVAVTVTWQVWGTNGSARAATDKALASFPASCNEPDQATGANQPNGVIGVLTIKSIGVHEPIIRGTDSQALARGVGWYSFTGQPGHVGNFALAGYRITHGSPLERLLELNKGDMISVQGCAGNYDYSVQVAPRDLTVHSGDSWVLDAVPGHAGRVPTESLLTITADQDLVPTPDRAVLFAQLVH